MRGFLIGLVIGTIGGLAFNASAEVLFGRHTMGRGPIVSPFALEVPGLLNVQAVTGDVELFPCADPVIHASLSTTTIKCGSEFARRIRFATGFGD